MNGAKQRILLNRIKNTIGDIERNGLLRKLESPLGIDFSSNDYLGLAQEPRLVDALIEGAKTEGVGSTGSRLLRGHRDCFREIETRFASWKGVENSLYFATGYQANVGVLQSFLGEDDHVFSDELNHASLIDGIRLSGCQKHIFPHLDVEGLATLLNETECRGQKFLIIESLFSMDGDIAPLRDYAEICRDTETSLIIDEAHSVGLYGERGSGLIEETGIENDVFLSINTAGKALGVSGAFVAGSNLAIEFLINRCRSFIFSTAPIPALAYALESAIKIIEAEPDRRERLREICSVFNTLLSKNGFDVQSNGTHITPILVGDSKKAVEIARRMQADGFDVRAIRPPTVAEGTSRLRVSLNVNLSDAILIDFVTKLKQHWIDVVEPRR